MNNHYKLTLKKARNSKIGRKGRSWGSDEIIERLNILPECARVEIQNGQLCWTESERKTLLALLFENIGIDSALSVLPIQLLHQAIHDHEKQLAALGGSEPEST